MVLIRRFPATSFGVLLYFTVVFFSPLGALVAVASFICAVQIYRRRARRIRDQAREAWIQTIVEQGEAERMMWREKAFAPGSFSVVLSGFDDSEAEGQAAVFLGDIPGLRDRTGEIEDLIERVRHISPEAIAEGIVQRDAVSLKVALEERGAKVKIVESVVTRPRNGREPIPKSVQREVWRRDGGQCVDCGSRDRLEYDHIVPVVHGGSNTVRNIGLRCESCNRRKGAKIGGGVSVSTAGFARHCPHCGEGMPRDAGNCPQCHKESPAWVFNEGVWWRETEDAWCWLDEPRNEWVKWEGAPLNAP
jgi:hypothetical protein